MSRPFEPPILIPPYEPRTDARPNLAGAPCRRIERHRGHLARPGGDVGGDVGGPVVVDTFDDGIQLLTYDGQCCGTGAFETGFDPDQVLGGARGFDIGQTETTDGENATIEMAANLAPAAPGEALFTSTSNANASFILRYGRQADPLDLDLTRYSGVEIEVLEAMSAQGGIDVIAVAADFVFWREETATGEGFGAFQKARSVEDVRAAARLIATTHNFNVVDNLSFNGIGTEDPGKGNIGYFSAGFSPKRDPRAAR